MTKPISIERHIETGSWKELESIALHEIAHAEEQSGSKMNPVLGGGTRLMLDLKHRVSDDIDLFVTSPQWIGYLTPRLTDRHAHGLQDYVEGGASLKLIYPQGEIDFICCLNLTSLEPENVTGTSFQCEDMYEVLAKKLFHRGATLTARDLFDWRALLEIAPDPTKESEVLQICERKLDSICAALDFMGGSKAAELSWSLIKTHLSFELRDSIQFVKERLGATPASGPKG